MKHCKTINTVTYAESYVILLPPRFSQSSYTIRLLRLYYIYASYRLAITFCFHLCLR